MSDLRRIDFVGRARQELQEFPDAARRMSGRQLLLLQRGGEPLDWKPMKSIGSGVAEIRVRTETGAYRVIYVAKFEDAIYVLRCFEKKSNRTSREDLEVAAARYRTIIGRRN